MKIVQQSATLLSMTPAPIQLIEEAGRTCYKSENQITDESASRFVDMITERGHHSVLEHASATVRLVCDRGISHELVRHRLSSFSQESTRYCNYGKEKFGQEITVIEPPDLSLNQYRVWESQMRLAEEAYLSMLVCSASPQIARSVLPTCLKTEIVMTANFRQWLHVINLRSSNAAHPQIRSLMEMVKTVLAMADPFFKKCFSQGEQ